MRRGRLHYLLGAAFFELAWTEWGPENGAPVICVHGLTRNGRDFDVLARALADTGRRVFCPDLPGRGESQWLADARMYAPPAYVTALAHLLARLDGPVDWVGTSLGGICGMMVAAAEGHPIRRLVLNDIGSRVPEAAVARIATYVQQDLRFDDLAGLEAHLREVHAPFGALSDADWHHMAETSARPLRDGGIAPHYDPAIGLPFAQAAQGPVELGALWDRVAVPVLLLRGAESDVLDASTAAEMARRPGVQLVEIPDTGHAPALVGAAQVARVLAFLA
ncbi:alpha/beta fold hydrolase [Falsiroseomonas sp. HC035]|uniref:alpha/beta fold hydrolase n=1 Tax=Falsiroseomonas sp. HC035 TaxID=3390999 RepID=UPI003D323366